MASPRGGCLLMVGNFLSAVRNTHSVCEDLAARLAQGGWDVVTTSAKPGRASRLADMVQTTWRNRDKYSVAQVDVYSGAAFRWAEIVCWLLRRAGKPYILTLHGGDLPRFSNRYPRRVGRLLNSATAVTVPSEYLLQNMVRYRRGLRLIPNGLDLDSYIFRVRAKPAPRLVWLRAFHQIYNPSLAPRVAALVRQQFPGVQLAMAGTDKNDGSWRATRRVARQLGVFDSVQWLGGVPKAQVPTVLDSGDIFLNTTNFDNTPVSVLEALASGLCVVSTNVGGLPHLLTNEVNALLVPAEDAEAMARAVSRILTEPGLAERLSADGRQLAERFEWSAILPEWQALLAAVKEEGSTATR